jgi:lactobin A/cerein 7B family class IIb bacteriocin
MKELNKCEIQKVNGGLGVLAAIGLTVLIYDFGRGFYDGYNS